MDIDGQCHCGHVTYEATIDPGQVSVCHCTDCQILTGGPYRVSVATPRDNIRLTGNPPKAYVKTAESGRKRLQLFCPECASPMFATGAEDDSVWAIRWGSIRQRRQLAPSRQIWCRSALPWISEIDRLPAEPTD